ncbi:MerR family transcriptional regulator [Thermoflavimicrobium dichotomicum]|uniref:DNA-binding transcriptional regulator, MerR family n=1 Tax=Thermoflavimicrobium dichotomicum TaxID=46223 RepID=A0A1I3LKD2_9BACL|nr:MerR family transcriptional regulator [Thermoflavimicrobium dichotomicum]SFI85201.1 DNA-binding transcriptional regulator, MerR family [Thermoflavimicrobium dichotomicum]
MMKETKTFEVIRMYTIGQFAHKANVTIRTLHYYEEIGLLIPSATTEGKHRLYSNEDFIRLQQIVTLKELGFSLKQIKQILEGADWEQLLKTQLKLIRQEMERLQKIEQGLESILHVYQAEGRVNWHVLLKLFQYSKQDPQARHQFIQENLNPIEQKAFRKLPKLEGEDMETLEWMALLKEVIAHQDLDPASPEAQKVIKKLWDKMAEWFDGDLEMMEAHWRLQKNHADELRLYPFEPQTIEFIEKGTDILLRELNRDA